MKKIEHLLSQVSQINKKNTEILDATGGRFNIFQVTGVNHYENTHSSIISEFLNTNGTHGLKSKFFECFLETVNKELDFASFNATNTRIKTEYSTSEGRIDILIEDDNSRAIIIENKIYAEDQSEQLKRYRNYAERTYKNGYRILYLTLWGDKASDQSGKGVTYSTISYRTHIIKWLEKCVSISSRFPFVRETLIQYINHIKQLTNIDMNTKNREEITELLSNIENLRAAKSIYQNYSATFDTIVEKHFNAKMKDFAKTKGLDYKYEESNEAYVRFYLTSPNWDDKCWLGFTFEGNRCHYGICNNPNTNRMSDENRKKILENIDKITGVKYKVSEWWPLYIHSDNLSLDDWENDIIKSDRYFKDCAEKINMLLNSLEGVEI